MRVYILFTLIIAAMLQLRAQDSSTLQALLTRFPFIKSEYSVIQNDSALYTGFFPKLKRLEREHKQQVVVAHIGDSHIQAGHITDPLRKNFQAAFGNAGRGLIFPYRVSKTNGPVDYTNSSNAVWQGKRNAYTGANNLPTGISGHTIYSTDSNAYVEFAFKPQDVIASPITRLVLFHNPWIDSNYDYKLVDTSGNLLGAEVGDTTTPEFVSQFMVYDNPSRFRIQNWRIRDMQHYSMIYGAIASNDNPGVLYHSIGVNGAEFRHYLHAEHFVEQLAAANPDLIILDMGTNEAYNSKNFDANVFYGQMDSLVTSIKASCRNATILMSILPESYIGYRARRKTYYKVNPAVAVVRDAQILLAVQHSLPWYDWYSVMGGEASMGKWHAAGMTDARRVHFSKPGYSIHGEMLYKALMDSYKNYMTLNP
jgi:lysophospholipase L1-like esterase